MRAGEGMAATIIRGGRGIRYTYTFISIHSSNLVQADVWKGVREEGKGVKRGEGGGGGPDGNPDKSIDLEQCQIWQNLFLSKLKEKFLVIKKYIIQS